MDQYKAENKETLVSTCRLLGIDRQVYYRNIRSKVRKQQTATAVVELISTIRREMPRVGTRKLYHILNRSLRTMKVGRDKLFSIMKANQLQVIPRRTYTTTTYSHHRFRKHKDLINKIEINRPEQVWVSDITYLGSRNNHQYLALVTDAYSKKIMGYDVSDNLRSEGAVRALKMAINKRQYKQLPLIHHSDKGLQYCSDDYQEILVNSKIACSMTESYDPYSNAVAERVNGILKDEFMLENFRVNLKDMQTIIRQSIDIYNCQRPHLSCLMLTPQQMHRQNSIKIKTYKKKNSSKEDLTTIS